MTEHASLWLNGVEVEVVALRGREALGELFRFEITVAWRADAPDAQSLVRANAVLELTAIDARRKIRGVVQRARRRVGDNGHGQFDVVLVPAAYELCLGRDCRTFRNASVVEIVDVVLGGVPHRWELVNTYARRDYCAQYREDNWTFATRLLEEEGIYLWFDSEEDSTLVLADSSLRAPDLAGGAFVAFAAHTGLETQREVVFELVGEAVAVPDRFTLRSFDPRRPQLLVDGTHGAGAIEHYDAPGAGPRNPVEATRRARLLAEAAAAGAQRRDGASTSVRLSPGRVMETSGHPFTRYDGRYLIVEASHEVTQRLASDVSAGASKPSYCCRFSVLPSDVPFRPAARASQPRQAGLQSGMVMGPSGEEIYPDAEGRVRVQLHWDREAPKNEKSGHWLRVAQRGTAESMLLPRVGWNVVTFNEEGSVDEPSVLSRVHDGEHIPSHGLPANQTRVVFRTSTSPGDGTFNEVYFEDTKGAEEMHLRASLDMSSDTQNQEMWQIGRHHTRAIANEQRRSVGTDGSQAVGGNQAITVAGNETVTVLGSRNKSVEGNESETIGGKRSLHVGASHSTNANAGRSLQVGAVLIDATLGPISSQSGTLHSVLVGGAAVKVTAQSMSESATLGSVQTVGGVKLEITKGMRGMQAKLIHVETVGGAMIHKTSGTWSTTTQIGTSFKVGGLLGAASPALTLEATAKIVLRCGGSTLTITPSDVVLVAPEFDLSDAKLLDAVSSKIDRN